MAYSLTRTRDTAAQQVPTQAQCHHNHDSASHSFIDDDSASRIRALPGLGTPARHGAQNDAARSPNPRPRSSPSGPIPRVLRTPHRPRAARHHHRPSGVSGCSPPLAPTTESPAVNSAARDPRRHPGTRPDPHPPACVPPGEHNRQDTCRDGARAAPGRCLANPAHTATPKPVRLVHSGRPRDAVRTRS